MKTSELLKAAKAKIADEKCWTQGALARDVKGKAVPPCSDEAVCFCSVGAVENVSTAYLFKYEGRCFDYLIKVVPCYIGIFNDTRTHAEVMAKWDEAIKLAEDDGD